MRKFFATVGVVIGLNACAAVAAESPDLLLSELAMLTGPNAEECGLVRVDQNPAHAWRCAQAAEQQGRPYWLALQRQGIDSDVWLASLRTPSGQHFILTYDSNYMGGPGLLPRFTREMCNGTVAFALGSRAVFQCSRK